ncbi:MAG: DEAD/DEAH box helicase [Spirochaetales bacterium]|nr:DEAD/DEAH box helicase [Spirochaetales bacterium]
MKFTTYKFSEDLTRNLDKLGFVKPTDIQYKAIPSILKGEDVFAVAQTGTGKTAAFAIPIIENINKYKTSRRSYGIKAIVMAPTRELTIQIANVFKKLARHTKVEIFSLYGGVEQDKQIEKLQDGIDVLVTTPGRMFDLINQKVLRLDKIDTLVIDEADHMLSLGFVEDIKYIKKMIHKKHQTLFFSATINPEIKKVAFSQVKADAIRIQISPKNPVSKNVKHFITFVEMDDKRFFLERLIKEKPNKKFIVFVRTKVRAERVAAAMDRVEITTLTLHSSLEQEERNAVMHAYRKSAVKILIATDISARGIDIADIDYVINYDLPDDPENYVHRVGRTGRGVNKGIAISFVSTEEKEKLEEIKKFINDDIKELKTNISTNQIIEAKMPRYNFEELINEDEIWKKKKVVKKEKSEAARKAKVKKAQEQRKNKKKKKK